MNDDKKNTATGKADSLPRSLAPSSEWFTTFGEWMDKVSSELQLAMTTLIERAVDLKLETPRLYSRDEVDKLMPDGPVVISVSFSEKSIGAWQFLFPRSLVAKLSDLAMMGEGTAPFDEALHPGTLAEIWGQVIATMESELSRMLGGELKVDMPQVSSEPDSVLSMLDKAPVVRWNLNIKNVGEDCVLTLVEPSFEVMFTKTGAVVDVAIPAVPQPEPEPSKSAAGPTDQPVARPAQFENLGDFPEAAEKIGKEPRKIDILLDVSLPITIELGRTRMLIRDVLKLGPGSIIELDKLSGEPVDLYVNEKKFAKGEVVVIEENFGVRITELIKVNERLKALK